MSDKSEALLAQAIVGDRTLWDRSDFAEIANMLGDDEVFYGAFDCDTEMAASTNWRSGVAALTNRRIIFVHVAWGGAVTASETYYKRIDQLSYYRQSSYGSITIMPGPVKFTGVDGELLPGIVSAIEAIRAGEVPNHHDPYEQKRKEQEEERRREREERRKEEEEKQRRKEEKEKNKSLFLKKDSELTEEEKATRKKRMRRGCMGYVAVAIFGILLFTVLDSWLGG